MQPFFWFVFSQWSLIYKITGLWEHWEMLQIYWPPQTGGTWAEQGDKGCQCLLWHWVSRAGLAAAKQQHQQQGQGTHLDPTHRLREPGWAVPVGSWPAGEPRLGEPQHTEPVFATLNLRWDMGSMGRGASCTKASVPDASLAPSCSMAWTSLKHPLGWIIPNFPAFSHLVATWAWWIPVPCLS